MILLLDSSPKTIISKQNLHGFVRRYVVLQANEPQVVKKRQKDISDIAQRIISMYAKGMTTRQISEILEDIYGFEASEDFISDVTDKIMPQIED